jgi:tripartite-type tricarboxylate transporter receptor subunit TctC
MTTIQSPARRRIVLASALAAVTASVRAQPDAFPTRPVNLIIPFPPGGAVDQAGRPLGQALSKIWKQPVVVNNKGGAGGGIGMGAAAAAPADGYTLLAAHPSLLALPESERLFGRKTTYDRSSFAALALLVADPLVLVVKSSSPWKTYEEFVADAKAKPDTITYSSSGSYGALHLPIEMLAAAADIKLRHIPYSGGGPAIMAVLSGQVAATTAAPSVVAPHIKSGEMRALVSTGQKRHPLLPAVRTAKEMGYKEVESYLWVGIFAPAKTDPALVQLLRRDIGRAVQEKEFAEALTAAGAQIDYRDGPDFARFLDKDAAMIHAAIQRIGKVD